VADHPGHWLSPVPVPLRLRPRLEGRGQHSLPEWPQPRLDLVSIDGRRAAGEGWEPGASPGQRLCLRTRADKPTGDVAPVPVRREAGDEGRVLACARCRRPVTTSAAGIEVAGGHEHRFVNPAGIPYHIGCFARAAGLIPVGDPSPYWTWFPGYRWQIEHCPGCQEHLGWLFSGPDGQFHGLILDRLEEVEP
jgi:hypothetical protein